jgi:hypothetical protein
MAKIKALHMFARVMAILAIHFGTFAALIVIEATLHKFGAFEELGVPEDTEINALIFSFLQAASSLGWSFLSYTIEHGRNNIYVKQRNVILDPPLSKKPSLNVRLLFISGFISMLALTFYVVLAGMLALIDIPMEFESEWVRLVVGYGLWLVYGVAVFCCGATLFRLGLSIEAAGKGFEEDTESVTNVPDRKELEAFLFRLALSPEAPADFKEAVEAFANGTYEKLEV